MNAVAVTSVARAAIQALTKNRINCCILGSTACLIYGMENRVPNDVDIVLLTDDGRSLSTIKELIVKANPKFNLIPSSVPSAEHRKLHYQPTSQSPCKIDIFLPGRDDQFHVPAIPKARVQHVQPWGDIPVMPILPLLLTKLQAWDVYRISKEVRMRARAQRDVVDLEEMLELAVDHEVNLKLKKEEWLSSQLKFMRGMQNRVEVFVKEYPESRKQWGRLGFKV
ncbi:hypothetical protein Moror_11888 [Moniliophthora roreri MCA 2997]|nr:hypothetical protein Moror_11888 [Moniliophthora roreri MCA 2997]KAI3595106.1 hypothetical protein WG66_011248 [Moniliophthora roreri]